MVRAGDAVYDRGVQLHQAGEAVVRDQSGLPEGQSTVKLWHPFVIFGLTVLRQAERG